MRLSRYFLPILKETPAEASIVSHRLMLRAGMIRQLSAGIYTWLPLGLAVLKKIEHIIHEEMHKAGAVELLMPTIQPAQLWQESERYDGYGKEMLRIQDRHEHALLYGPTNEEVITDLFRKTLHSYKDLPKNLYHIQWKFRDEIRPRFGVMRGREFLMKDGYSFDIDYDTAVASYDAMFEAYLHIFKRLGLSAIPVKADTGPIGGKLSHEFHILADTGESAVYYDKAFEALMEDTLPHVEQCRTLYAMADDMHNAEECTIAEEDLRMRRGIEVGHIFHFGTKYSQALNAKVTNKEGKEVFPEMGSYGIGVSRLVGAIIEACHDEYGIIWPEAVAPFTVGIINVKSQDEACSQVCEEAYEQLRHHGVTALYDDRKESAGSKFSTMDLIGLPWQLSVGPRGVASGVVELKHRRSGEKETLSLAAAIDKITRNVS